MNNAKGYTEAAFILKRKEGYNVYTNELLGAKHQKGVEAEVYLRSKVLDAFFFFYFFR